MLARLSSISLAAACTATLVGCASVHVIKVTDSSQQPEGIPFYLPRPYVQVFEPFVIGSKTFLASGKLSPDGKYLLIDNAVGGLDGVLVSDVSQDGQARVAVNTIRKANSTPSINALGGNAQGETEAPAPTPAASAPAPKNGASTPDAGTTAPTGSQPVGNYNVSVTNTSSVFPPSLGRKFFDIVWMPDFDEKYVVQGRPGLGDTNIGVTMTQGWGLYGLDAKVDNSALVKPLLDFYSTSLGALSSLAKSKIFPAGVLAGGGAQGAIEIATLPASTRVTIKVTRVQVVAPGMYPILKPSETAVVTETADNRESRLGSRHIPLRPYTNIAFNTYEVVVVEAAKPAGDTPMNLQHYFESVGSDGGPVASPAAAALTGSDDGASLNATDVEAQTNAKLANRKGADGAFWTLSSLKKQGASWSGTAKLSGGSSKPTGLTTMSELATFVSGQTNSKVLPGNIKLTEGK